MNIVIPVWINQLTDDSSTETNFYVSSIFANVHVFITHFILNIYDFIM